MNRKLYEIHTVLSWGADFTETAVADSFADAYSYAEKLITDKIAARIIRIEYKSDVEVL